MIIVTAWVSCSKKDTTAPVISILGDNPLTIILNNNLWADPGASATDDEDGELTVVVNNKVDHNLVGEYEVIYSATDAAGNTATAKRTVIVRNAMDFRIGTYQVVEYRMGTNPDTLYYSADIDISIVYNKKLWIHNFGDYGNACNVSIDVNSSVITIPDQDFEADVNYYSGSVIGDGSVDADNSTLNMNYIITYTNGSGVDSSTAVLTKQ